MKSRRAIGAGLAGVLLGLGLTLSGCEERGPLKLDMDLEATNTADRILVVEGTTHLPAGAPLTATITDPEGQVYLRDRAVVQQGRFFFDFDISSLNGLTLYQVWVKFDPRKAPFGVRLGTGFYGEKMEGRGVIPVGESRIYRRHIDLLLTSENWDTRDFQSMSEQERERVVRELEKLQEDRPDDRSLQLALAKGFMASDPREIAAGSRAHQLLRDAARAPEPDKISQEAEKLLSGIAEEEKVKEKVREQRQAAVKGFKYYKETQIKPGRAMGGFVLGTPYDVIRRHFTLNKPARFSDAKEDVLVTLKELPGVELTFGKRSRRLVRARTTSPKYVLREGFKVGSLLQELQNTYGRDVVPTPKFTDRSEDKNGNLLFRGKVLTNGLEFEILKTVDPVFGLPVDKVEAISVFKP